MIIVIVVILYCFCCLKRVTEKKTEKKTDEKPVAEEEMPEDKPTNSQIGDFGSEIELQEHVQDFSKENVINDNDKSKISVAKFFKEKQRKKSRKNKLWESASTEPNRRWSLSIRLSK